MRLDCPLADQTDCRMFVDCHLNGGIGILPHARSQWVWVPPGCAPHVCAAWRCVDLAFVIRDSRQGPSTHLARHHAELPPERVGEEPLRLPPRGEIARSRDADDRLAVSKEGDRSRGTDLISICRAIRTPATKQITAASVRRVRMARLAFTKANYRSVRKKSSLRSRLGLSIACHWLAAPRKTGLPITVVAFVVIRVVKKTGLMQSGSLPRWVMSSLQVCFPDLSFCWRSLTSDSA